MSQRAIREYDAKSLRAAYTSQPYHAVLIDNEFSFPQKDVSSLPYNQFVVKPDQLFGKRGKYGLVGVKLDLTGVEQWIDEQRDQERTIGGTTDTLDTFLIEKFVPHDEEYYLALKTQRDYDEIIFSAQGGVEIEENRDYAYTYTVPVGGNIDTTQLEQKLGISNSKISDFISQLHSFFVEYGFSSLEINPFVFDEAGNIVCLDMVARVDTCEQWKQRARWKNIKWVRPFGAQVHPMEAEVEKMDAETGASLKFSTLNPHGRIALLLGGGGASVVAIDTLADRGLLDEVINYGELSGNPNYRHNKKYTQGLIDLLCEQQHVGKKRLCLFGGIANFTRIDVLARAFVDALDERVQDIIDHDIHLFVRRGGVSDTQGLKIIEDYCKQHNIPHYVADGDVYLTEALQVLTEE